MGLFFKIYSGVAILLLGVIIAFIVTAGHQEVKIVSKSLDNNQLTLALSASSQIQTGYFERIWPFELLREISKDDNFLFWYILDGDRKITLSSKSIGEITEEETGYFKKTGAVLENKNYSYLAPYTRVWLIPIEIREDGNDNPWLFCLGYSTKNLKTLFRNNFFIYLYLAIALIVLIMPITTWLISRTLKPLKLLAHSSTKIREGIFDVQIPSSNTKEIKQLIVAYKAMLDGLKHKDIKINEQITQINAAFHELEELNRTLEKKVDERTRKLYISNNQLKKISNHLSIEKEKAESATKSISAFMANMSHEIRTPLNAILGFSAVLERRENDEKKLGMIKKISLGGETLLALINDILDLSKIDAKQVQLSLVPFDMKELLNEIHILFSGNANLKKIDFQITYPEKFHFNVITDPVRLKQVIINLVGNAFKFTEEGSIQIKVGAFIDDGNTRADITIDISDTGAGIPSDQQKRIFEAFVQKDGQSTQKYGGTGLGLAISLKLAHLMGGNLYIKESTPGKGSTFSLFLENIQLAARKEHNANENKKTDKILFSRHLTILYIDDIAVNCAIFREFLLESCINYTLIECHDGQAGIDNSISGTMDIVFVDLKMPPPTGIEVTQTLRANEKTLFLPIIALTASTEKTDHENFLNSGGNKVLLKPLKQSEIMQALRDHLTKYIEKVLL